MSISPPCTDLHTFLLDVKTRRTSDDEPTRVIYAVIAPSEDHARRTAESFGHTIVTVDTWRLGAQNRDTIQSGVIPCETDPYNGKLSRTLDPFHATATTTVGSRGVLTHVCASCAERWHTHKERKPGIKWA